MKTQNNHHKIFALVLAGLFLGSAFAVMSLTGSGEDGDELGVALFLEQTEIKIPPEGTAHYYGIIQNTGDQDDHYEVLFGGQAYGLEGVSVSLYSAHTDEIVDPADIFIPAGEKYSFFMDVTIIYDEGVYEVSMMVRSHTDDTIWDAEKTRTHVIPQGQKEFAFELKFQQKELTTIYNVPVTFMMTLVNTGNVDDLYVFDLEMDNSYTNVEAYLMRYRDTDSTYWEDGTENDLEVYLQPDTKTGIGLVVNVDDPFFYDKPANGPGTYGADNTDPSFLLDMYKITVTVRSQGDPDLVKKGDTFTLIGQPQQELSFECYEPAKSIHRYCEAEYFLFLFNYGWTPVEVSVSLLEYETGPVSAQLFMVAPYWIMDPDVHGEFPGANGNIVFDSQGNVVELDTSDIIHDDYGGLIPVDENFTYVIYPGQRVEFLLKVGSLIDVGSPRGDEPTDEDMVIDIGVKAESVDLETGEQNDPFFSKTIITKTTLIGDPKFGFEMWVDEWKQVTLPNQPVEYIISLENTGNLQERIVLTLGGEYGLFGVYAYMYLLQDWNMIEPIRDPADPWFEGDNGWDRTDPGIPPMPIVIEDEDGTKEFYNENFGEYNDYIDCYDPTSSAVQPCMLLPDELIVTVEAGRAVKVVLWVMVEYQSGEYGVSVNGLLREDPDITGRVDTITVIKEEEYKGFEFDARETEQTAGVGDQVDYFIRVFNPSYYTDTIILDLGGRDLNREGVKAQLFIKQNVYYYEPSYGDFLLRENNNYYLEHNGYVYDPGYYGEKELREKNPGYDDGAIEWDMENNEQKKAPGSRGEGTNGEKDGYVIDNSGNIYKNYEYEKELWEGQDDGYNKDNGLLPLPDDSKKITLGPFQEIWLVLRVVIDNGTGEFNIDVSAQSQYHPEYKRIIHTITSIRESIDHGLQLFIGDPVHYTSYGITTIYVFKLTNTGDVRDQIMLDLTGPGADAFNVYIEVAINGMDVHESIPLLDQYGNTIFSYDDSMDFSEDRYSYKKWAEDENTGSLPGTTDQGEDPNYKKQYANADGEVLDDDWRDWPSTGASGYSDGYSDEFIGDDHERRIGMSPWGEPVEYSFMNWDEDGFVTHKDAETGTDDTGGNADNGNAYHMTQGFMPYSVISDKYVELEAGESVFITMKVTVFDPSLYYANGPGVFYPGYTENIVYDETTTGSKDPDDAGYGEANGKDNENGKEGENGDPDDDKDNGNSAEKNNGKDQVKQEDPKPGKRDYYIINLHARSVRFTGVSAQATTHTYIYDEDIRDAIRYGKVSGVFNVHDRNMSKEILEAGFEIIPLLLESGIIQLKVSADFQEGRIIIININATNLEQLGNFEILFDSLKIGAMDPEKIGNYTGDEAKYAVISTDEGIRLMVYIPHFSEHIISVQSSSNTSGGTEGEFTGSIVAAGILLGLAVGLIGFGMFQKQKETRQKEFSLKIHEITRVEGKETKDLFTPITRETGKSPTTDELDSLLNESLFMEKKEGMKE